VIFWAVTASGRAVSTTNNNVYRMLICVQNYFCTPKLRKKAYTAKCFKNKGEELRIIFFSSLAVLSLKFRTFAPENQKKRKT
jgi:hypothetical protein